MASSTAAPPRRQAAIKADEINRLELEQGKVQEEEDEEEDSDYVSGGEEDQQRRSKKRRVYDRDGGGSESMLTEMAKIKAAQLFAKLTPQITEQAKRAVALLLREDREEEPEDPKKKRRMLETWVDPMLAYYVAPPKDVPVRDALLAAQNCLKTFGSTTVQEKVKFAGQEVEVSKKVDKVQLLREQEAARSSLDTYIDGITKKQGITTVEKSSYDWEKYKEEKKLNEELQDAHKSGFVERQQFLNRVDERQFERERTERERERALREASQPQRPSAD